MITLFISVTAMAGHGIDELSETPKNATTSPQQQAKDFPNPLLKLLKFFFKDYNNYEKKKIIIRESDTTLYKPKRVYHLNSH